MTGNSTNTLPLLNVKDLRVHFHTRHGVVRAVDGISFEIRRGEVLGIVGESGSGKSVSCLALMGLLSVPPAKIESGTAVFNSSTGRTATNTPIDLLKLDPDSLRRIRGNHISMIFQEPMTSLNPYMKIGDQLSEVLMTHEKTAEEEARECAVQMLDRVGIPDPRIRIDRYPHEFSGGMRQRVMIAMALLSRPDVLIADEPTTALDVTIQAQILELIRELKTEIGMSVILISHAMGVVADLSDQIIVMYAGRAVEHGAPGRIFQHPAHPYTKALIESMPRAGRGRDKLPAISGAPPDLASLPGGCAFEPRCSYAKSVCRDVFPDARSRAEEPDRRFHCHVDI